MELCPKTPICEMLTNFISGFKPPLSKYWQRTKLHGIAHFADACYILYSFGVTCMLKQSASLYHLKVEKLDKIDVYLML